MTGTLAIDNHTECKSEIGKGDSALSHCNDAPTPQGTSSGVLATQPSSPLCVSPDADPLVPSTYFASCDSTFPDRTVPPRRTPAVAQRHYPGWFHRQPTNRKILIDWMDKICARMHFSGATLSLAVLLLDVISGSFDELTVNTPRLSLSCVTLASKLHEPQNAFLKAESIFDFFGSTVPLEDIYQSERFAFTQLEFNLNRTTTFEHLCRFFAHGIATAAELRQARGALSSDHLIAHLELMGLDLHYHLLGTTAVNSFASDLVAAAILRFLRGQVGLHDWPKSLVKSTGFRQNELDDCVAIISGLSDTFGVPDHSPVTQNTFTRDYLERQQAALPTPSLGPVNAQAASACHDPVAPSNLSIIPPSRPAPSHLKSLIRLSQPVHKPCLARRDEPPTLIKSSGLKRTKR